jgi:hypothetical protein
LAPETNLSVSSTRGITAFRTSRVQMHALGRNSRQRFALLREA